jgi:hypothetical protein
MNIRTIIGVTALFSGIVTGVAAEKTFVSLRNFKDQELKAAGFEVRRPATIHITALGGGGNQGWSYKSDRMFAYGWIIDATTRRPVWEMTVRNTQKSRNDRAFDGTITLEPGKYEAYFGATTFSYHTTFTHININVDHRNSPVFGSGGSKGRHFFSWLTDWWSDDINDEWSARSPRWGLDLAADDQTANSIGSFQPPSEGPAVVLAATKLGDNAYFHQEFSLSAPATVVVRAIGEGMQGAECVDCGWIVNAKTRERVWSAAWDDAEPAGGARKNLTTEGEVLLEPGTYMLYAITDDSHSNADWNDAPPFDPYNWGVTVSIPDERERRAFTLAAPKAEEPVVARITKVEDSETRSEGFSLKQDAKLHIYAFGERDNTSRSMADYASIIDAKTRERVWTMDVDRTSHAGGAAKNRYVDEVITLPRGNYIVNYVTDDSHAYNDWNDDPPFDRENYGITITTAGGWNPAGIVSKFVEEKDRNIVAQLIRMRDDEDRSAKFSLDRTTRIRVYAIGEGQGRDLYDFGWIEDARTRTVAWEMTYGMTFHAGGGRKNRMVNTSIVLDRGDYVLRYRSDDSHSYAEWNVDPPDDREYWGITLYRDMAPDTPPPPPSTGASADEQRAPHPGASAGTPEPPRPGASSGVPVAPRPAKKPH